MSWSFAIRNGDLDVSNAQIGTARGAQKLVQDFRCALLESLGNDDMQPSWGSILDGGVAPDGTVVPGVVGTSDPELARLVIEGEVRRIATYIQQRQLQRIKQDRLTYSKATLTASEILVGVTGIRVVQTADELAVLVTLQTGANDLIDVAVPITEDTLVGT